MFIYFGPTWTKVGNNLACCRNMWFGVARGEVLNMNVPLNPREHSQDLNLGGLECPSSGILLVEEAGAETTTSEEEPMEAKALV